MCRLFGLAAPAPVTATFWLLDAPDSLRVQSHREPDGTGLGHFDADGRPRIEKQALAAYHDRSFAREARTVHSATFVAHIRFASTGGLDSRNTHPFEQRGRLFAHNGVLEGLGKLERHLGDEMGLVQGETDSERLFALITSETERRAGDVGAGIAAAVDWVADNLPVLSLNFVLIEGDQLWALRYPDTHELQILERSAGEALEQNSSHGTRVRSEHAAEQPTVVVASERLDPDPNWRMLAPGELVHVSRAPRRGAADGGRAEDRASPQTGTDALRVESAIIRTQPPAHPLTLAELEGRARSSQA
jgi:predicted glutamine amidotransferase